MPRKKTNRRPSVPWESKLPPDVIRAEELISRILDSQEQNERVELLKRRVRLTAKYRAIFMGWIEGDFNAFYATEIQPLDKALENLGQKPEVGEGIAETIKNISEAVGRLARLHDGQQRIRRIIEKTEDYAKE